MKNKIVLFDLLFYLVMPYVIWKYGQAPLGDYYAILLSTAPGFLYTIVRFGLEKQFNITGMFLLSTLLISTVVDILSGSAFTMLQNSVYVGMVFGSFFIVTMIIRKPIALYFAVDIAYLQGHKRENSLRLYQQKALLPAFYIVTAIFAVRSFFSAGLKQYLIGVYGVQGYDRILFFMKVNGWVFSAFIAAGFIYTSLKVSDYLEKQKENTGEVEENVV
ncbi:VC0807 family protein [Sutcliffiella halmapala]|uniref:VC0807 family protein n=1 Tax=Sutcliffiella halmapala TaxID=79882 RepID=UPI0009952825|nr:VC0807 family protein [Sutcliffiella halmapala]